MFSPRRTRNIVKSQLPREKLSEKSCETASHLLLERDQNSYIYDTFSQLAIVREVLHASFRKPSRSCELCEGLESLSPTPLSSFTKSAILLILSRRLIATKFLFSERKRMRICRCKGSIVVLLAQS